MNYPRFNRYQSRSVSIPDMSGGINLADALNLVDDNQMTDCKNLWYENGVLKTRPTMEEIYSFNDNADITEEINIYSTNLSQYINGEKYVFLIKKSQVSKTVGKMRIVALSKNGKKLVINKTFEDDTLPEKEVIYTGKSTLEDGEGIYLLSTEKSGIVRLYEATGENPFLTFTPLNGDDLYAPTVYLNGKGTRFLELPVTEGTEYAAASFLESCNLLNDAWNNFYYTADGISSTFNLPVDISDTEINIEYFCSDTEETLTFGPINHETFVNTVKCNENSDYIVTVNSILNSVFFQKLNREWSGSAEENEYLGFTGTTSEIYANNIKIKVKFKSKKENKLSGMQFSTWFGGNAEGINGGTRLFLAGNETEKNLIVWSDVNKPTYFPKNNYAYVGDSSQKITALKKQSDMLVIFKENELFYSKYTEGNEILAEEITGGSVIDITANSAYFPMIQVHSEIGCDIPKSIQLCNDRLVWCCKNRRVYMLKGNNQYSTANVIPISAGCERALKSVTDMEILSVKSCVFKGHYLLSFGTKTFVLDYDQYYFDRITSYSDSNKRQKKLVWYIWDLPFERNHIYTDYISGDDECCIITVYETTEKNRKKYSYYVYRLSENSDSDFWHFKDDFTNEISKTSCTLEAVMQTKLFDFGLPANFKKIEQVYMGIGALKGNITVKYITDNGNLTGGNIEICDDERETDADFINIKRLVPLINRALRFGIRLECKGRMAVDSITINYKLMGVTR